MLTNYVSLSFIKIVPDSISYLTFVQEYKNTNTRASKQEYVQYEDKSDIFFYEKSQRGNDLLHFRGHKYIRNNIHGGHTYWKCTRWHHGCKARAITMGPEGTQCLTKNIHNHE